MRHLKTRANYISSEVGTAQAELDELADEKKRLDECIALQNELGGRSSLTLSEDELDFLRFMQANAVPIATRLEELPNLIALRTSSMIVNLTSLSNVKKEETNVKKNAQEIKKEKRRNAKTFGIFGGDFEFIRSPEYFAQELWGSVVNWERISLTGTVNKIREFSLSLMHQAQNGSSDHSQHFCRLSSVADHWADDIEAQAGTEGLSRKKFYEIMISHVPDDCDLHDHLENIMESLKTDRPTEWGEKLFLRKDWKEEKKKTKEDKAVNKDKQTTQKEKDKETRKAQFHYRNWHEYKASGVIMATPGFAKPVGLPANRNKWCGMHGFCEHHHHDCRALFGRPAPRDADRDQERDRSNTRRNDRRVDPQVITIHDDRRQSRSDDRDMRPLIMDTRDKKHDDKRDAGKRH